MDILEIILKYGLSIRQIPLQRVETYSMHSYREGFEIIDVPPTKYNVEGKACRRITIPNHAGYWMCKQVNDTDSRVQWNIKRDNLAPTLEESIGKFIASLQDNT